VRIVQAGAISSGGAGGLTKREAVSDGQRHVSHALRDTRMTRAISNPVVHLELRTGNLPRACAFYTRLFGWRAETIHIGSASYIALELGRGVQGGVVEHQAERSVWIPYVEVVDIADVTERARRLGATVTVAPREGPAGWRSVLVAPAGATVALWQPKV
jgi:predicted enzyme related to lactoylglutathione lyase